MAVFLLWNVQRKPLDSLVEALVRQHNIDVVLLVEYAFGTSQLSTKLLRLGLIKRTESKRFGVFVRATHRIQRLNYKLVNRVAMWRWTPPSGQDGLITLVHGFDRRNYDDSTRRVLLGQVAAAVRRREVGRHRRSIILGDFNAQPFESAIMASDGLHALGIRAMNNQVSRRVAALKDSADFFYNPMWRLYGHLAPKEAGMGTHYWEKGFAHEYCWHMIDQVVIRPEEVARFPEDRLSIITAVGSNPANAISLLDAGGQPDSVSASDHLPVLFHWNL
jgi:hypothetical protein